MNDEEQGKDGLGCILFVVAQVVLILLKLCEPKMLTWWMAFAPSLALIAASVAGVIAYIVITWLTTKD